MYGGHVLRDYHTPNEVFILSIPAFQWFQAEYQPAIPRSLHTCHTTNTNQLIIIGGVNPTYTNYWSVGLSNSSGYESRDSWAEGIGIFDMTTLKFKDSYEAKAKPYEPPKLIKSFYRDKSAKPFSNLNVFFFL